MKRRKFIHGLLGSGVGLGYANQAFTSPLVPKKNSPIVVSTWDFGEKANEEAWRVLRKKGRALDAVEQGVRIIESDVSNQTVGLGGLPDREGKVTLDASIMDEKGNAGSVCFLQHIEHPISVARKVMEDTPHVMLAGAGALQFALEQGFRKIDLLTEEAQEKYQLWKEESKYQPIINIENHDTIGMLALDARGDLSGACTTSGLAYKMHGRVGDSPIIGAGLYVDNEVGAATATGMGEAVMKTCGTFLVVELMRQGYTPQEACKEAVMRVVRKQDYSHFQIGFLALDKLGNIGAYAIHSGFTYAVKERQRTAIIPSQSYVID